MWIDILYGLLLLLAVIKGLRRGLVLGVLSGVGIIVGLAAAIKLSTAVAGLLKDSVHVSARWLPVLAFLAVFIAVILLVRLGAKLIEGAMDLAMMGWVNKLGGVLLYAVVYTIMWSVLLFYVEQLHILSDKTLSGSITYSFVRPWGPVVIEAFGRMIPFFKGMFAELKEFFGRLGRSLQHQ